MLTPKNLKSYQREAILHMLYNPNAMLWLQMGLGKTIITLTSIVDLKKSGKINKTLIFGPLRVIESVWVTEIQKWSHTNHLTCSIITGTEKERKRSLFRNADIYLINYENTNWLVDQLNYYYIKQNKEFPFQCVIYDEVSKFKNSTSLRLRGGKRDRKNKIVKFTGWDKIIPHFKYRYGLTGTPASNGYIDLHGQFLVVDNGNRLGTHKTHYLRSYFCKNYNGFGYMVASKHYEKLIENKISDITLKMDAKDYLDIPTVKEIDIMVDLPLKCRKSYNEIEKDYFTELDSGTTIEVSNGASKSNKCLQFCNGSPYINIETKEWEEIHDVKLKALDDILEEASGQPVLCSYTFTSDAERIMKYFKKYKPVNLTKEPSKNTQIIINKWNKGQIKLLIGHPGSMGHGIDGLQQSGSIIVWFGLNWNFEYYEQMNGRINRQGQSKPVSIIRILCNNTLDTAVSDALKYKDSTQSNLKRSIDNYRNKIINFI